MGNAQKALVMAAGIFLAIALITVAVVMFVSAQDATKTAQQNFSSIQNELAQTSFTVYDNTTVSGSQVVNALRKYKTSNQDFGIEVITGSNSPNGVWYSNVVDTTTGKVTSTSANPYTGSTSFTDSTSTNFINPTGKFDSKLIMDSNNVVRAIVFTQQK